MNHTPKMLVFDLYGTLIQFGVKRHPYRRILKWAKEQGRKPAPDDARIIMTLDEGPNRAFERLGIRPPDELMHQFFLDINEELDSLSLYDDVVPTLNRARSCGLTLAVCSNLAKPYGAAVEKLLSQFDLLECLSYQVGAIKPEEQIYNCLVESSGYRAGDIIFIGDNRIADYEGPSQFGFRALHLIRGSAPADRSIGSLAEVPL